MNKKESLIPFAFVALSLLFILVCAFVYLSKGKSKKWLAWKMKIGGLLLAMNVLSSGAAQEIQVSCYDFGESDIIALQNNDTAIVFKQNSEKKVKAYIDFRISYDFSFCLIDEKDNKLQSGTIVATDGKFDYWKENFEIRLDKNLKAGRYYLLIYDVKIEEQDPKKIKSHIQIDIKNE